VVSLSCVEIYKYISLICSILITLFLLLHDWINIYPLNDLATFNKYCSLRNKIIMTIVNTSFFIIYTLILMYYWTTTFSSYAKIYIVTCNTLFLIGILFSWWIPYLFGWPKEHIKDLHKTHGTTHTFLPHIKNNPTPNTLHVIFHLIFVINMIASYLLINAT
jgi:hypothetical protein